MGGQNKPKTGKSDDKPTDNRVSISSSISHISIASNAPAKLDMDKLAKAVAMQETHDCTKGYGAMYNNCFGIKKGSIVPCKTGLKKMCIFDSKEEAYIAFKKIWQQGYGGEFPTIEEAKIWSGGTGQNWLKNVSHFYNKL